MNRAKHTAELKPPRPRHYFITSNELMSKNVATKYGIRPYKFESLHKGSQMPDAPKSEYRDSAEKGLVTREELKLAIQYDKKLGRRNSGMMLIKQKRAGKRILPRKEPIEMGQMLAQAQDPRARENFMTKWPYHQPPKLRMPVFAPKLDAEESLIKQQMSGEARIDRSDHPNALANVIDRWKSEYKATMKSEDVYYHRKAVFRRELEIAGASPMKELMSTGYAYDPATMNEFNDTSILR